MQSRLMGFLVLLRSLIGGQAHCIRSCPFTQPERSRWVSVHETWDDARGPEVRLSDHLG